MSNNRKKSKAVPVVLVIMLLVAALAAGGFLLKPVVTDPIRQAASKDYEAQKAEDVAEDDERVKTQAHPATGFGGPEFPEADRPARAETDHHSGFKNQIPVHFTFF